MKIDKIYRLFRLLFQFVSPPKINLYLTFDDGPLSGTNKCYEICKKNAVKATFFMVGKHLEIPANLEIHSMIRNSSEDFDLYSHSYHHTYEKYMEFYGDLDSTLFDFIIGHEIVGGTNKITRLPGFNAWKNGFEYKGPKKVYPVCEKLFCNGFSVCGWDIEWEVNKLDELVFKMSSKKFRYKILQHLFKKREFKENNVVILIHDIALSNKANQDEFEAFLKYFNNKRRFKFLKIQAHPFFK